ncbi:MAG: iron-sulfur cluster assembly scaffold protein [bacterium]|nr:iron-sulfur cluster assembly scaffold protein [bacterium]
MYSEKLLDHFKNPRNMGRIENADGIGKVGNPVCGDVMWIYIKIGKNNENQEIIEDIKFETFGCGAAVATSSVITELAKGKTLEEAEKITNQDVIEILEGLPPLKKHCSLLAEQGLKAAINDYRERQRSKT